MSLFFLYVCLCKVKCVNSVLCVYVAIIFISLSIVVGILLFRFDRVYHFFDLQIICTVKKHIVTGGPKKLPFTVPPLIFSSLKV